jgi:DNA-binding response OmpR family regulator
MGCSDTEIATKKARPGQTCEPRQRIVSSDPLIRIAAMSDANSTVLIIDDDADLRASVGRLLRSLGIDVQLFASISDFLKSDLPDGPTCLVLDVRLPDQSGLDLQRELASANRKIPIIFITGYGDIPMSVEAMKGGAIEFLTKPFRDQDLLNAIQLGLARDRVRRESGRARPPEQTDCPRYWHRRSHGEGAERALRVPKPQGARTGLHLLHRPTAMQA